MTATKKMGRPTLPKDQRRGASMGFRPTPEIRQRLEAAAQENGRSMSQEIEHRLERSFIMEDVDSYLTRVFAEMQGDG